MKKVLCIIVAVSIIFCLGGCEFEQSATSKDVAITNEVANRLQGNQPTPTDIDYSLERYNLIRRAYWVNGMREKANALPCEIEKPLGHIVLFTESGAVVGSFVVDGKVSSLNSFLTPDSEYYSGEATARSVQKRSGDISEFNYAYVNQWLADVDGSYGENDNGIFFFTTDGKYIEWTGTYLYSDIPFIVDNPVVRVGE